VTDALVFVCHHCGRPRPVKLVGPLAACPACNDASTPPATVRTTIQAARVAALNLPFRAEQLRATQDIERAFDAASDTLRRSWGCFTVVLAFPAVIVAIALVSIVRYFDRDLPWALAFVGVFVSHLLLGWFGRWRRRRRQSALCAQLDVRPTRVEPLVCRVCGAPLGTESLDAPIITCSHCHGENVLDEDTVERWARDEIAAFNAIAASVQTKTERTLYWEGIWMMVELYAAAIVFGTLVIELIRRC
jgi:hypothetical protein